MCLRNECLMHVHISVLFPEGAKYPLLLALNICFDGKNLVTHETEPLSICSKSTMETELQVKFVQSSQQRQKKEVIDVVQVSLLLTWNIFHTLF